MSFGKKYVYNADTSMGISRTDSITKSIHELNCVLPRSLVYDRYLVFGFSYFFKGFYGRCPTNTYIAKPSKEIGDSVGQVLDHPTPSPDIAVPRLIPVPECPTTCNTRKSSPTSAQHNFVLRIEKVALKSASFMQGYILEYPG